MNSKTKKCENVPSDGRLCAFIIESTHSFLTSFKDANAEVCRASITLSVRPLCKNKVLDFELISKHDYSNR